MSNKNRSNDFLQKTYDHLKNKVLPDAIKNKHDFPPEDAWVRIIQEIENSIDKILNELNSRNPH